MKEAIYATLILCGTICIPLVGWLFGAYVVFPLWQASGLVSWYNGLDPDVQNGLDYFLHCLPLICGSWFIIFALLKWGPL